jgi:hypothetical protein
MKLIPMQKRILDGTPLIQADCQDAIGQPFTGHPDMIGDAYRHRRGHQASRAQRTGTSCGLEGRPRFLHPLVWKHQRVRSQRHLLRCLRPPARSAPWHVVHFLPPRCALRSRKSPGRYPICRTPFRSTRPHDTPILYNGTAVPRGDDHAAPQALFYQAARSLDNSHEGSIASPSEATPSRQLRETTEHSIWHEVPAIL